VLTLAVAPGLRHRVSRAPYEHYSLLAPIEDALGVERSGRPAEARSTLDLAS
jgi:hypothetical protein